MRRCWLNRQRASRTRFRQRMRSRSAICYGTLRGSRTTGTKILGPMYEKANVASGLLQYDGTIADSVKNLAALPLLFNPGDRFEYSLGVDVLGRLVEVVSGKPLDEFFRTRIFEPLGMKDTYFYPPENKLGRLATAYTYYPDKGLNRFPDTPIREGPFVYSADYPTRGPKKLFSGGAGLVSTAMDYARFCQMMLDEGKVGDHATAEPEIRGTDDARSARKDWAGSGLWTWLWN